MTDEELELIEDGRKWRAWWSPEGRLLWTSAIAWQVAEAFRQASVGVSLVAIGYRLSEHPSFEELLRVRAELGPLAGRCGRDREAMRRWVATGSSEPRRAAA